MAWAFGAAVALGVVLAIIDRLTDASIMRKRVNRGTDRYRASVDYVAGDEYHSIADIRIGSGEVSDPMAKRLWIPPEPSSDDPQSPR